MSVNLTKSNYLLGHQCEKALWLRKHRNDLASTVGPGLQRQFDEGHLVGRLAHRLYPGGRLIESKPSDYDATLAETMDLMHGMKTAVFEGAGRFEDVFIRADILAPSGEGWDLIEVKSSTEVKDEHYHDMAVQWYVLSKAGIPLRSASLLHINRSYIREGEIDPSKLFVRAIITDRVKQLVEEVPKFLDQFRRTLSTESVPSIEIGSQCNKPYECRFYAHCWDLVPPTSIQYLPRLSEKKRVLLREQGISDLRDVKDDFPLTEIQKRWWQAANSAEPLIDHPRLRDFLDTLMDPISFIDFETLNLAIPPYDGVNPYTQIPIQVSVRVIDQQGEDKHLEFLGDGRSDPRVSLARFLSEVIPNRGSVVAYNASFEAGCLDRLGQVAPECAGALSSIRERLWDLKKAFSDGLYLDSRFAGSASIKDVLPVLVPDLSYEGLAIRDGGEATAAYIRLMGDGLSDQDRAKLRTDLSVYCGQDTKAMVRILEVIKGISKGN